MKFGDKLILLRKRKGLSQEELAEKLGVSRQSVSKWESNNTYPETERIIEICNLFECSMDDLINDDVVDINKTLRSNKNNYREVIDSFLDFITKTINMFSSMSFLSGLKCLIEMGILVFILFIISLGISGISASIISSIFTFLGSSVSDVVYSIFSSIFGLICFIVGVIVVIHTFKIRYLDYYDKVSINNREESFDSDSKKINNNKKTKVVIRDNKDRPFAFLGILSKTIIWFIKLIVIWFALITLFVFIWLIIGNVILLSLIRFNVLFLFLSISLLGVVIVTGQLLLIMIYFVINRSVNVKVNLITFIICVVVSSVFLGLSILSIKNFNIITDKDKSSFKLTHENVKIDYRDNLIIDGCYSRVNYRFIKDDSLDKEIKIEKEIDKNLSQLRVYDNHDYYGMNKANICGEFNGNFKYLYNVITSDLSHNKIRFNYDFDDGNIVVYASSENINKLIDNLDRVYFINREEIDGVISVKVLDKKIISSEYADYNVLNDTISIEDDDYMCYKDSFDSRYGKGIEIKCDYKEE